MKVLVFSSRKEAVALVGRDWDKDGKMLPKYRQFSPIHPKSSVGQAYMTLDEANYLVESEEARKYAATGSPQYWYPSGFPVPVGDEKGGSITDAFSDESIGIADERQVEAARKQEEERQTAMAAAKARHNAKVADEEVKQGEATTKARKGKNAEDPAQDAPSAEG